MIPIYTPWKYLGGIKLENWLEIGQKTQKIPKKLSGLISGKLFWYYGRGVWQN